MYQSRDKMATILQITFSNSSLYQNCGISIKIPLKFVAKGPIDN